MAVGVVLGASGNLVSASARGHAGQGAKGADIVCASVTVLLRTTLAMLASRSGLETEAETAGRGSLAFRVTAWREEDLPFLQYAAAFLREGISSIEKEYPKAVVMRVETGSDY
ncbi:ribosomal-processing cysteine protease Prp [Treponema zuelzerae]|uniref:Ribosomal processing cysteine protease Prp n=1 Tax=Teretinema zuelzerae TaxID=156 RepID=A0AAE3EKL4_9SPIR|nr:ribosomal-processing cysteine protease Prp [Spirochaetales bacterium]MCD1655223.1 ribosomal-processing cysteine protease Prp [Teretinema zuelzerae]